MSRGAKWVLGLVGLQLILLLGYWAFERTRSAGSDTELRLGIWPPTEVDLPLPALSVVDREGRTHSFDSFDRPTLLHFWATWCPPCRGELPALLELSTKGDVDVVAIAVDDNWEAIDQLLRDAMPGKSPLGSMYLGRSDAIATPFDAPALPITFLVAPGDRLRLRFDGPREWDDEDFVRSWWPTTP